MRVLKSVCIWYIFRIWYIHNIFCILKTLYLLRSEDAVNTDITPVQGNSREAKRGVRCVMVFIQKTSNFIRKRRKNCILAHLTSIVMQELASLSRRSFHDSFLVPTLKSMRCWTARSACTCCIFCLLCKFCIFLNFECIRLKKNGKDSKKSP